MGFLLWSVLSFVVKKKWILKNFLDTISLKLLVVWFWLYLQCLFNSLIKKICAQFSLLKWRLHIIYNFLMSASGFMVLVVGRKTHYFQRWQTRFAEAFQAGSVFWEWNWSLWKPRELVCKFCFSQVSKLSSSPYVWHISQDESLVYGAQSHKQITHLK